MSFLSTMRNSGVNISDPKRADETVYATAKTNGNDIPISYYCENDTVYSFDVIEKSTGDIYSHMYFDCIASMIGAINSEITSDDANEAVINAISNPGTGILTFTGDMQLLYNSTGALTVSFSASNSTTSTETTQDENQSTNANADLTPSKIYDNIKAKFADKSPELSSFEFYEDMLLFTVKSAYYGTYLITIKEDAENIITLIMISPASVTGEQANNFYTAVAKCMMAVDATLDEYDAISIISSSSKDVVHKNGWAYYFDSNDTYSMLITAE